MGLCQGFVIGVLGLLTEIFVAVWYSVIIPWEWWNSWWGLTNIIGGHVLFVAVIYFYVKTNLTPPGRVPEGWVRDCPSIGATLTYNLHNIRNQNTPGNLNCKRRLNTNIR